MNSDIDVKDEIKIQKNNEQDILNLYNQLIKISEDMIEDINNDDKMIDYLSKINIKKQQILESFRNIIKFYKDMIIKSLISNIAYKTIKQSFQYFLFFKKSKDITQLDSKGRIVWYLEIQIKIHCSIDIISNLKLQKDITNSPSSQFKYVWDKITIVKTENHTLIKQQYKSLKKMLHATTSAALNQHQHNCCCLSKKIIFGLSLGKYFIMNDSAKLKSFVFYRNPTIQMAQSIWNFPENGATRQFSKLTYEKIRHNFKIYIPINGQFDKNIDIFEQRDNTIIVRVLSNKKLIKLSQVKIDVSKGKKEVQYYGKIMIHMHGGGFLALSSRSMQNHTRKWANTLQIPIFSIDYRMPPQFPFPQAPYDCYTVYKYLMKYIDHYLNIKPTQVYLAGDSAGGNLACSLTALILKNKQPIPKGIYIAYPAADLRYRYTSSRINAITDPLLWPPMLLLCLKSYLNNNSQLGNDPLASPVLLTEEFIGGNANDKRWPLKWPKTVITIGKKDPLLDDSLIIMQRMVQSNIDCKCIVYEELSHGFLSSDLFVKQCGKTIVQSIELLKQLISS